MNTLIFDLFPSVGGMAASQVDDPDDGPTIEEID